jgi:hypothetical protein
MAFFPDVTRGEEFKPNALLSNNIRHLVNAMNGFGAKPMTATGGMIRIQVYNNTGSAIAAGTAVNFSESGTLCGDAVPAEPLKDVAKPWGVVVNNLAAKALGSCILCGPATVSLSGSGEYAAPSASNPATFTRGATGSPVIFAGGGKGVILLGASSQDSYDGPFALSYDTESKMLKIKAGYLSRNGEFKAVGASELSPQTGMVCVASNLDSEGNWSEPEVKFSEPGQFSYPVGSCKTSGESVTVCSFRVPVAILLAAGDCSE